MRLLVILGQELVAKDFITHKKGSDILILTAGFGRYYLASQRLKFALLKQVEHVDVVAVDISFFRQIMHESDSLVDCYNSKVRGFNYWKWKPIIIDHFLSKGYKIVVYIDAGCEVNPCLFEDAITWFKNERDLSLLLTRTGTTLKQYVKPSVIDFFDMHSSTHCEMFQFGIVFLKGTQKVLDFFRTATKYALNDDYSYLFNDELEANEIVSDQFIEHRHDQSVMNMLLHKYFSSSEVGVVNSTLEPDQAALAWLNSPILAARNSKGISTYRLLQEFGTKSKIPKYLWFVVKIKNLLLRLFNGNVVILKMLNDNFSCRVFSEKLVEFSPPELIDSHMQFKKDRVNE